MKPQAKKSNKYIRVLLYIGAVAYRSGILAIANNCENDTERICDRSSAMLKPPKSRERFNRWGLGPFVVSFLTGTFRYRGRGRLHRSQVYQRGASFAWDESSMRNGPGRHRPRIDSIDSTLIAFTRDYLFASVYIWKIYCGSNIYLTYYPYLCN